MNWKYNKQRNYYRNGDIVYNEEKRIRRSGDSIVYDTVSDPSFTLNESNGNLYYTSTTEGGESYSRDRGVLTITVDPFIYLKIDVNRDMDLIAEAPNILEASFELDYISGEFIINV